MPDNVMRATTVDVDEFLGTVPDRRRDEARILIAMMREISGEEPTLWGPSIIGFGSQHYRYDTGREGDAPLLAFSPRKAQLTIYFGEGFERYAAELADLGKHKTSVTCLYASKLVDLDLDVLRTMLQASWNLGAQPLKKPTTVDEYLAQIPPASRARFQEARALIHGLLPNANEVLSYGLIGFQVESSKRALVYLGGWSDHVSIYPAPKDPELRAQLKPHLRGPGTLWFDLDAELPRPLIERVVRALAG